MKNVGWLHRGLMLAMALVVAACTSRPPPIPPPTREQVRPIALEESGLACLDLAPEVVAAHHERAPMFGASSCDTRALDYAGAFGLIGAIVAIGESILEVTACGDRVCTKRSRTIAATST